MTALATGAPQVVSSTVPGPAAALVRLAVPVGSAHEAPGEDGLAHLVEHLVVRGLDRAATAVRFEAATGRLHTTFTATVLPRRVPAVVRLLGAAYSPVPTDGLAAELVAIDEERAQRRLDPRWSAREQLFARLWAGTGLEHSTMGGIGAAAPPSADVVRRFHGRHYHPEQSQVAVVSDGSVAIDEVRAEVAGWSPTGDVSPAAALTWPGASAAAASSGSDGDGVTAWGRWEPHTRVPAVRAAVAARVVHAAGGVRAMHLRLGTGQVSWCVVPGSASVAATTVAVALAAARACLGASDADLWMRRVAVLPELRAADAPPAVARRALECGSPSVASWERDLASVEPAQIAAVLDSWAGPVETG